MVVKGLERLLCEDNPQSHHHHHHIIVIIIIVVMIIMEVTTTGSFELWSPEGSHGV